jgi:hypothetical protein
MRMVAIGPINSGSPFHFHCDAVNALVYGRKRWWLYPPSVALYSKQHPVLWHKHGYKQLALCLPSCLIPLYDYYHTACSHHHRWWTLMWSMAMSIEPAIFCMFLIDGCMPLLMKLNRFVASIDVMLHGCQCIWYNDMMLFANRLV